MARKVAKSSLNASTVEILNVIRRNAPYEYQASVPVVESVRDIPAVGEIIYGNPAFSNIFIDALINRIALVQIQSAMFNNPYRELKKGYLEYGETVEEIFVGIAKVVEYSQDKAKFREYQRTLPDVKSAFHVQNWRVLYPITIEDDNLKTAFLSVEGVQDLIARIVDQIYTAREYDDFLLTKYLIIKNCCRGKFYPVSIGDGEDMKEAAVQFRGNSSALTFMSDKYNEAHVLTTCPRDRQLIFMDSFYNARYDVEVLAAAFNMDRTTFEGRLHLIDDFTTFDNNRFEEIREATEGLEPVTNEELEAMKTVKAVLIDQNWFQIYDNLERMTEKYNASGLYWNYFLHVRETVSSSPFSDALVFITDNPEPYETVTFTVDSKSVADGDDHGDAYKYGVITLNGDANTWNNGYQQFEFLQTPEAIDKVIGVEQYGAYMFDRAYDEAGDPIYTRPYLSIGDKLYGATSNISCDLNVGDEIEFVLTDTIAPLTVKITTDSEEADDINTFSVTNEETEEATEETPKKRGRPKKTETENTKEN